MGIRVPRLSSLVEFRMVSAKKGTREKKENKMMMIEKNDAAAKRGSIGKRKRDSVWSKVRKMPKKTPSAERMREKKRQC